MQVSAFYEIQMINGLPLSIIDCIDKDCNHHEDD